MNIVSLCGKIKKITRFERVTYITLHCKDNKNSEFLDVTLFDTKFFDRYFCEGMWIGIRGHLHKNKNRDYRQEIIADNLFFIGDVPDFIEQITNIEDSSTGAQIFNIDETTGEIIEQSL